MPVYAYLIVNAVLAAVVLGALVGLHYWAIVTQHRDPGCADVRLRRLRLPAVAAPAPRSAVEPELAPHEIALT